MFTRGKLSWLIWNLIISGILIGFGIANLINRDSASFQSVIILIFGIVIIVDASTRLLLNVLTVINEAKKDIFTVIRGRAVASSLELAIGISIIHLSRLVTDNIADASFLFRFFGDFLGIAAIVVGTFVLIYGIILGVKKVSRPIDVVFNVIGSAVLITAGILILIYLKNDPRAILSTFFIIVGAVFLAVGTGLGLGTLVIYRFHQKALAQLEKELQKEESPAQQDEANEKEE